MGKKRNYVLRNARLKVSSVRIIRSITHACTTSEGNKAKVKSDKFVENFSQRVHTLSFSNFFRAMIVRPVFYKNPDLGGRKLQLSKTICYFVTLMLVKKLLGKRTKNHLQRQEN